MFDLEIAVVAPDAAKRTTKRAATKRKRTGGRGAPGRPKSSAHRKAISAGLKRYWGSKRASYRRRKGTKARASGKSRAAKSTRAKRSRKSSDKKAIERKFSYPPKRAPRSKTVNAPKRGKPKKPTPAVATGAQVASAAKTFPRRRGGTVPRVRRTR